jgi:hypothetical protein
MSHPFDATLKDVLAQDPSDFTTVFGLPKITPARTLNVDLSTISAATDVAFGFGDPLQEIVDLNFQSGPDTFLPARMLLYNAAYYLRNNVPVRSMAILLRPKADSPSMTGKLVYSAGGNRVEFDYEVVRMWQQPAEPFLHGGLGLLPLATLCRVAAGKDLLEGLRDIVREIDRRLAQQVDHGRAVRLMTAAFILSGMRLPKESLANIYDGVRIMHESTAYDMAIEEGEIRGSQQLLLRMGSRPFGAPDAQVVTALKAIQDFERLERMADAIFTAKSWQELLSTP